MYDFLKRHRNKDLVSDLPERKHRDFYRNLRDKLDEWLQEKKIGGKYTKFLLLAPDIFHLLCKLSVDPDVPRREKVKVGAAIAYFITPVDIIPDIITGPVGYMDDLAVAAFVLNGIVNHTDPEIVKKHWAGDENILEIIKMILSAADNYLGKDIWRKIKDFIR